MSRDNIYSQDHEALEAFAFDDAVARGISRYDFKRSVPGYTNRSFL